MDPSESNAFARALARPPRWARLRMALALVLTLVLAGCFTLSLFLLGALIIRGARARDLVALGAAVAVIALTFVMARGRRRR